MSRRTNKLPAAASRRTRRSTEPQAAAEPGGSAEAQRIVLSNPIFYCGNGGDSKPPPPGDQLRCVYGRGAVRALVHDPAAAGSNGIGKPLPLPLPPCRAHRGARVGPAVVVGGPRGTFMRKAQSQSPHPRQDPFLAAYVACTKSSGGGETKKKKKKKKKKAARNAAKDGGVRGCGGVWNGWAAGAMYARAAMSCKNSCAVVDACGKAMPAAAAKEEAEAGAPAGPTLDLSWAPVVLSRRAMERRREQR